MVCVGAANGLSELFPTGRKLWSAMANARAPERRMTASPPSPSGVAMAAMVSSGNIYDLRFTIYEPLSHLKNRVNCKFRLNMPAVADLIFRITALQKQPRLFVTFFVHIMRQRRIGVARKQFGQFIQP